MTASTAQVHMLHVFPSFEAAGAQARTAALMTDLGARYRHSLVALDDAWGALQWVPDEVALTRLDFTPGRGPMGTARALARLLKAQRPDILCTYNWGSFDAVMAARWTGQGAHVHHEDGFHAAEAKGQLPRRVWARRLLLPRASALAVPSRQLETLALETWRLPREKLHWIPNGVDTQRFEPEPEGRDRARLRSEQGIPREAIVIGGVGRLNPVKRFDRLIRACARITPRKRPVHLWIAGAGDERESLEALAQDHLPPGGEVHFLGYRTDLVPLFRSFDVFAISSDSEQQPVSQLEAMACGVPLVGTDVGDVRGTLPEAAGRHLVALTEDDVEGRLAAEIDRLLSDETATKELASQGRARVLERYSRSAMVQAYSGLYSDALREAHG